MSKVSLTIMAVSYPLLFVVLGLWVHIVEAHQPGSATQSLQLEAKVEHRAMYEDRPHLFRREDAGVDFSAHEAAMQVAAAGSLQAQRSAGHPTAAVGKPAKLPETPPKEVTLKDVVDKVETQNVPYTGKAKPERQASVAPETHSSAAPVKPVTNKGEPDVDHEATVIANTKGNGSSDDAETDKVCDEKLLGEKGDKYIGCQTKTRSGKTCQKWNVQTPHTHSITAEDYPGKGLGDNNYCRNPDGENTIWCYTDDPVERWEYCETLEAQKAATEQKDKEEKSAVDDELIMDGVVEVRQPAMTNSERIQLEEDTDECMVDTPAYLCFEKFGSYGIQRLHTEQWEDIVKLGYERPDWMAHANVQKRHLFNLTLPGTANSGAYAFSGDEAVENTGEVFGLQTQHLNIVRQLEAGVRAFDFRVSFNPKEHSLYLSHGKITVPLADVLGEIRAFMDKRTKEVIVVYAKIAKETEHLDDSYREVLEAENNDPGKVPGEMVHSKFNHHFGSMLVTYKTLKGLPDGESETNPRISSLVEINSRVVYFWEGQQVLCTDHYSCESTPGWTQPWHGLTFGWPLPIGERAHEGSTAGVVEPACLTDSWGLTASAHPDWVVKKIKMWALNLRQTIAKARPLCFPEGADVPTVHKPTLLYWADAITTLSEAAIEQQQKLMGTATKVFSRGEGMDIMTSAERTNYLLLVWFMKKDARVMFTQPNVIAHDFVQPIIVHRIIEAMQETKECGWAIKCKPTGSCWAASLLGPDGECRTEDDAIGTLTEHANSKEVESTGAYKWMMVGIGAGAIIVILVMFMFMQSMQKEEPQPLPAHTQQVDSLPADSTSNPDHADHASASGVDVTVNADHADVTVTVNTTSHVGASPAEPSAGASAAAPATTDPFALR